MKPFVLKNPNRDDTAKLAGLFVVTAIGTVLASAWLASVFLNMLPLFFRDDPHFRDAFSVSPWLYVPVLAFTLWCVYVNREFSVFLRMRKLSTTELMSYFGCRLVGLGLESPYLRRLVNINEEIAIASGRHAAKLWWMKDEAGINAFTAGVRDDEAAISVTEGALRCLNRHELMAVVAHEYGHVVSGDVRRNTLMLCWLALLMPRGFGQQPAWFLRYLGLLGVIAAVSGVLGFAIDRFHMFTFLSIVLILISLIFWLPGRLVTRFWRVGASAVRLSHAAVCREREREADALSAQFTRDPESLSAALRKIGGLREGARLQAEKAAMFSHMCIVPALVARGESMYATHPSIPERLEALGFPLTLDETHGFGFGGADALRHYSVEVDQELGILQAAPEAPSSELSHDPELRPLPMDEMRRIDLEVLSAPPDVAYARRLLSGIPEDLRQALRTPAGARAAARALLRARVADDDSVEAVATRNFAKCLNSFGPRYRLPLLSLAIPALQEMSPTERSAFIADLRTVINSDGRVTLHELVYFVLLSSPLREPADKASAGAMPDQYAIVLGVAAHAFEELENAVTAFSAGASHLGLSLAKPRRQELTVERLQAALEDLRGLHESQRRQLVAAVTATVARDGSVSENELEFVRAVAAAVGCPIPPADPG